MTAIGFPRSVSTTSLPCFTAFIALEKLWFPSLNPMHIVETLLDSSDITTSVPAFSRCVKLRTARQQRPSGFVLNAAHNQRPAYIRFFQIFGLFPSQSRSRGTIHDHEHGLQILRRNVLANPLRITCPCCTRACATALWVQKRRYWIEKLATKFH